MIEFWVTRSPKHDKYPGGLWRFWAETWDSVPLAERLLGPDPSLDNTSVYRPDDTTLAKAKRSVMSNPIWALVDDEAEVLRHLLGGER